MCERHNSPSGGPTSDGRCSRTPSLWSPKRHPVQECGDPVATSPGCPRSIWNPTLKARALLAGAQLPSSLDMPTPQD